MTVEVLQLLQQRQNQHKVELDAHQRDILFAVGTRRRSTLNTRIFPSGRCSPHNRWACSGVWLLTRTAGHDVSGHT